MQAAGFEVVVNLALPTSDNALANEGSIVSALGMSYVHIPVNFENPTRQLEIFPSVVSVRWWASGEGSVIHLGNVTNIVVASGQFLTVMADAGGHLDLRRVRTLEGVVGVVAVNANSVVDLTDLNGLWTAAPNSLWTSTLSASDGGTILVPNVTALERVSLELGAAANVNIAQLRSFTDGTISLISRTNGFSSLTNFSGSLILNDARLDWTNFTRLSATNRTVYLWAGQGSVLDLSGLTNVLSDPFYRLEVNVSTGSRIDLRRLRPPNGAVGIESSGADSVVNLSEFTGLWDGMGSGVTVREGGTVLIPNVTAMNRVTLDIRGDAILPTEQIRSHTRGSISLYRRTNGFAGLTNFTGNFYLNDSRLDLTNFTVFYATNDYLYFGAGERSFIDLSRVTNIVTESGFAFSASVYQGSRIDLRRLRLPVGTFALTAFGDGSLVDLSGLSGVWRGAGAVAAGGGAVVLMPNVTALDGIGLSLSDSAQVNVSQLTSIENAVVFVSERTNDFPALTKFSGSVLHANASWLELTNLTVLYATNGHVHFRAHLGGVIDLSNITNLVTSSGYDLYLEAYGGGRIDLRRLPASAAPGNVEVWNAGSFVDLSGIMGSWTKPANLRAGDGATIGISNVTAMQHVSLSLSDTAVIPTAQVGSINDSQISLYFRTNVFAALTNFTGGLYCSDFAKAALPKLTQLNVTNGSMNFTAVGESVIDLSQVTNGVVGPGPGVSCYAYNGGRIELPLLETLAAGYVLVLADGPGAVVNLSGLTEFFSDSNAGILFVRSGGTILLMDEGMLLAGVAIDFQGVPGAEQSLFLAPSQSLVLYGQPWRSYRIEARDPLKADSAWVLYGRVPLTEPLEMVGLRPPPQNLQLRVSAFIADPPEMDIRIPTSGMPEVILYGVPERTYQIEKRTELLPAGSWQVGPTTTMSNSFFIYPETAATNTARFYRGRQM